MITGSVPAVFRHLAREENLAVDAALLAAWPQLEDGALDPAVQLIVERGRAASQAALVARFREGDPTRRSVILKHVTGLFSGLRKCIHGASLDERASAMEVIVRSDNGRLLYLLADALRLPDRRTREMAAAALHLATSRFLKRIHEGHGADDAIVLQSLASGLTDALHTAVWRWETHHQKNVLQAAMWLSDRVWPSFRKKLDQPQTKIARVLNDMMNRATDPRLAGFILRALAIPALRPTAARAIGQATDLSFIRAILAQSWLLNDPSIGHGARWIRESPWLHRDVATLLKLDGDAASAAVRLLAVVGGSQERRLDQYRELIGVGSPQHRRAVVWQLVDDSSDPATTVLSTMANRCAEDIRPIAIRELRRRQRDMRGTVGVAASAGPSVMQPSVRDAFERYWEAVDQNDTATRAQALDALGRLGDDLVVPLRTKLTSPQPLERARALRVAGALGLIAKLQEPVYGLVHDADPVVRGHAVASLVDLPGPTTTRLLREALHDPDERVQANAIEVLDKLDVPERVPQTQAMLESRNSRVRANAVKSLLRVELDRAAEVLLEMLEDPTRAHRLSALWVIERLRLESVIERVRSLGQHDADARVRQRAARVAKRLLTHAGVQGEVPRPMVVTGREARRGGPS